MRESGLELAELAELPVGFFSLIGFTFGAIGAAFYQVAPPEAKPMIAMVTVAVFGVLNLVEAARLISWVGKAADALKGGTGRRRR